MTSERTTNILYRPVKPASGQPESHSVIHGATRLVAICLSVKIAKVERVSMEICSNVLKAKMNDIHYNRHGLVVVIGEVEHTVMIHLRLGEVAREHTSPGLTSLYHGGRPCEKDVVF